jgi:hypothetical protein
MCDYSLMSIPNRLAVEGEDLVTHWFPSGSLGLASPRDVCRTNLQEAESQGFWSALKNSFKPIRANPVPAVCVPPGARLMVQDIPAFLQRALRLGPTEEVTFTQLSASAYNYRDAIRFKNGRKVLLQDLCEGQRVRVVDLASAEPFEPVRDVQPELVFRRR